VAQQAERLRAATVRMALRAIAQNQAKAAATVETVADQFTALS
jgi:hypothetical protein